MASSFVFLSTILTMILSTLPTTSQAQVQYQVTNNATGTPGGARFAKDIGIPCSKQILRSASSFIWRRVFHQTTQSKRKNVQVVHMFVDEMDGVAYAINNEIHLSARYIASYSGDVKREVAGVLYHESTHIWQWNGNGEAPGGLIEGVADYVRLKAGYVPSHWVRAGEGNRWDQGYDVTARFLDYCDSLRRGFVGELNEKLKSVYNEEFFEELLAKTVDEAWRDYKAKYNTLN